MDADALEQKLVKSGEQQRLKELVKHRLQESGWHDDICAQLREIIKQRGPENVTVDELVKEVTPKARQMVPENVKLELLNQIKAFMQQQTGITDI